MFFAGQITGVEGYVESALSGLMTGIYLLKKLKGEEYKTISEYTVAGALAKYITTENKDFQPMNANFGILPPLDRIVRDKAERKAYFDAITLKPKYIRFIQEKERTHGSALMWSREFIDKLDNEFIQKYM